MGVLCDSSVQDSHHLTCKGCKPWMPFSRQSSKCALPELPLYPFAYQGEASALYCFIEALGLSIISDSGCSNFFTPLSLPIW